MNLSFRQISTFREVMRSGSISHAARTVGRTQPAVSTMIATLESELGFKLFERDRGKLRPTPEARFFLEECEDILARVERTKRTLRRVRALDTGALRIACHPAAAGYFMPRLLTAFLKDKPSLDVSLIMRSSDVIEDMIASQQFDLGFAETPRPRASITQVDFDLDCVCAIPAGDALADKDAITPDDLDGRPMALLFDDHATARQTSAAFQMAGKRLNRRIELRTFLPGMQFVESGLCFMVCDMITAHSHLLQHRAERRVVFKPFHPRIGSSVSLLTPGYLTPSLIAQDFCRHVAEAVEAMRQAMRVS